MAAIVLFAVTSYASAAIFNSIDKEIEASEDVIYVNYSPLNIWKRRHLLACDTVDAINDCFGWIIFFFIPFLYLSFISETFNILNLRIKITPSEVSFVLSSVIQLSLICFPSHELQVKVTVHSKHNSGNLYEFRLSYFLFIGGTVNKSASETESTNKS